MPCYDPREREDREQIKKDLDSATRVACELSHFLRNYFFPFSWVSKVSNETRSWIEEHDKLDVERKKKERESLNPKGPRYF
jgi:hypothetical protein